jgi:hypothetical protein
VTYGQRALPPAITCSRVLALSVWHYGRFTKSSLHSTCRFGLTEGYTMSAAVSDHSIQQLQGQALLDDVVRLFIDLLIASGATMPMIQEATNKAVSRAVHFNATTTFTELGSLQRDCMEVMCTWRREVAFVDENGDPMPLHAMDGPHSFASLCSKAPCKHLPQEILAALLEFGAVSIRADGKIASETPTFLLGRVDAGGRLATDVLLKHLEGYLRVVHGNVCSVSGHGRRRFERACTVSVATELEPIFDRLVRHRGQEFIDSIDEWLERNAKYESPSSHYLELGAGAYFINLGIRSERTMKP